jgi:hypothetical protein
MNIGERVECVLAFQCEMDNDDILIISFGDKGVVEGTCGSGEFVVRFESHPDHAVWWVRPKEIRSLFNRFDLIA